MSLEPMKALGLKMKSNQPHYVKRKFITVCLCDEHPLIIVGLKQKDKSWSITCPSVLTIPQSTERQVDQLLLLAKAILKELNP